MSFDQWFDEYVGYSHRFEWFYDDLNNAAEQDPQIIVQWLKSAYQAGYDQGRRENENIYWDDGK